MYSRTTSQGIDLRDSLLAAIAGAEEYAVLSWNTEGIVTSWNRGAEVLYGYSAEEMLGKSMSVLIAPDHPSEIAEMAKKVRDEGRFGYYESRRIRKDGRVVAVSIAASPIYSPAGGLLGVWCITRDISEREQQMSNLYRAVADVIFILAVEGDGRYRFTSVNSSFYATTGLPAGRVEGKLVEEVIPESSLPLVLKSYSEAIRDKRPVRWIETSDYPAGTLTGAVSVAPVFDRDDRCTYLVGAVHDITVLRQLEEEILRKNAELESRVSERTAQLEAANSELAAFSHSVAHDLRAPLRGIDGFSQALLEDYRDRLDAQGVDYLQRVRSASQLMGKLIDDMLNLSRVTRAEMRLQNVNLTVRARTIAENLRKLQPDRRVTFVIADGLVAQCDPGLLQAVLENLMDNAWKFTSRHPSATIEFGAAQKNGVPAFYVRDDGAGFDMAYADKLFGIFQRLHPKTEFDGTGVGLSIVKRIINRHGGRVWAEGAVELGATIYFTLQPERNNP